MYSFKISWALSTPVFFIQSRNFKQIMLKSVSIMPA